MAEKENTASLVEYIIGISIVILSHIYLLLNGIAITHSICNLIAAALIMLAWFSK